MWLINILLRFLFVPNCYKIQKMCEESVSGYPLMLKYCPGRCKTQETCGKTASRKPYLLKYCPYKYIATHQMCKKALDNYILTLKFVPNRFFTIKMFNNLDYGLFLNDWDPEYGYDDSHDDSADKSDDDSDYFKILNLFHGSISTINVKHKNLRYKKGTKNIKSRQRIDAYKMSPSQNVSLMYVRK